MKTHFLSIAGFAFALAAVTACSSSSSPSSNSSSSSSSSGGTTTTNPTGTTGSSTSAQQTAINGTWDITAAGSDQIGPSSMTINGGQITGTLGGTPQDDSSESTDGTTTPCTGTDKTTFSITVNGDTATAAFNTTTDFSPAGCGGDSDAEQSNLTATRKSGSNTSNDTFSGDWTVNDASGKPAFAVNILSLVVKAWSTPDTSGTPTLTSTVANGQATSQTTDQTLTFAARKQ